MYKLAYVVLLLNIDYCDAYHQDCIDEGSSPGKDYKDALKCVENKRNSINEYYQYREKYNKNTFDTFYTYVELKNYMANKKIIDKNNEVNFMMKMELNEFADMSPNDYGNMIGNNNYNKSKLQLNKKNNCINSGIFLHTCAPTYSDDGYVYGFDLENQNEHEKAGTKQCVFDVDDFGVSEIPDEYDWRDYNVGFILSVNTIEGEKTYPSWLNAMVRSIEQFDVWYSSFVKYFEDIKTTVLNLDDMTIYLNNAVSSLSEEDVNELKISKEYLMKNMNISQTSNDKKNSINTNINNLYEHIMDNNMCYYVHTEKNNNGQHECNKEATLTNYCAVKPNDEEELKKAVYNHPVVVSINANTNTFQFYKSGIYSSTHQICGYGDKNNHALLLIGYGTDRGIDYWIAKNSWGTNWGENGHIRIKRNNMDGNVAGTCGIASYPTLPM